VFLCSKRQLSNAGASVVLELYDFLTFGRTSSGIQFVLWAQLVFVLRKICLFVGLIV
jgi:hypothetical protein